MNKSGCTLIFQELNLKTIFWGITIKIFKNKQIIPPIYEYIFSTFHSLLILSKTRLFKFLQEKLKTLRKIKYFFFYQTNMYPFESGYFGSNIT